MRIWILILIFATSLLRADDFSITYGKANEAFSNGNFNEAWTLYNSAETISPTAAYAVWGQANCLYAEGFKDSALNVYRKALNLAPDCIALKFRINSLNKEISAEEDLLPLPPYKSTNIRLPQAFGFGISTGLQAFDANQFQGPQFENYLENGLISKGFQNVQGTNGYTPSQGTIEADLFYKFNACKFGMGYRYIDLGTSSVSASGSYNIQNVQESDNMSAFDNSVFMYSEEDFKLSRRWDFILKEQIGIDEVNVSENDTLYNTANTENYSVNDSFVGYGISMGCDIGVRWNVSRFFSFVATTGFYYTNIPSFTFTAISSNYNTGIVVGAPVQSYNGNSASCNISGAKTGLGIEFLL